MSAREILSANLRLLRTEYREATQSEAARSIGVSRPTYAAWEEGRGTPKLDALVAISFYHQISIHRLLTERLE